MYNLCREEMETTINWCTADNRATIDTADPVVIRKLDKLAEAHPDIYECIKVDPLYNAKVYTVPVRYIRFGKPASEARREAARRNSSFSRVNARVGES